MVANMTHPPHNATLPSCLLFVHIFIISSSNISSRDELFDEVYHSSLVIHTGHAGRQ